MPLSSTACCAAAMAYCVNRSMRRVSPREMPKASGSKSLTSAATEIFVSEGSKRVILPTPHTPSRRLA